MEEGMYRYRFSKHFNHLTLLGAWTAEWITNPLVRKLYFIYCLFWLVILCNGIAAELLDLFFAWGDFQKVTYNLSTTSLVVGYPFKMLVVYIRNKRLNKLRLALWKDSLEYTTDEDVAFLDDAFNQMKQLGNCFYTAFFIFYPSVLVFGYFSYLWGPRKLPFAGYTRMDDPMDDMYFLPHLILQGLCGFLILLIMLEGEMSQFSLLLQLEAFLNILRKNIMKLNEIYADEGGRYPFKKEVNIYLQHNSAKRLIRDLVQHHLKIIGYVNSFEYVFNEVYVLDTIGGVLLTTLPTTQTILYMNVSLQNSLQMALVITIMGGVLLICHHTSKVMTQCADVGYALYSTCWYKMDPALKRNVGIIMVCSRRPPQITAGKFYRMNLKMYLAFIKAIYSWLMLIQQVIEK